MSESSYSSAGGADQMDELKTEIREEKDWNQSCLYIEVPVPYEEDYEIRMIRNNDIPGLLKVTGIGSEGKSRYAYHTGGYISLAKKFEKETVDRDMIMEFTCQFIETVNAVRDYILDPDGILLAPEYIYVKEGRYKFCYLPMSYRCLKNSFHEMTEFFVKKLDYRDTEGIFLAYILHRSTLQEEYDLRAILDEYISEEKKRREEQKQKEDISDGTIFTVEDEGEEAVEKIYTVRPDDPSAMEEKKRYGPIRKMIGKIRTGRWGNWQDLITEIDGQDIDGHL